MTPLETMEHTHVSLPAVSNHKSATPLRGIAQQTPPLSRPIALAPRIGSITVLGTVQ